MRHPRVDQEQVQGTFTDNLEGEVYVPFRAYWVFGFSPIGRDPRSTSEAPSRFESQVGTNA